MMTMTMDTANALRAEIAGLGDAIESARGSETKIAAFAEQWHGFTSADCLGSGPSFGAASFAGAKLTEAAGVHAMAQDAEEFHHLNYFVEGVKTVPAILFAQGNALSKTRTYELSAVLQGLGRPHAVITDDPVMTKPEHLIPMPTIREWFAPIIQAVPASLLAAHWAARTGTTHYRGHTGAWAGAVGAGLVRNSKIELQK
jgi:glucosamine--fructose-6-phosphate aminotransferase (isomerizing)